MIASEEVTADILKTSDELTEDLVGLGIQEFSLDFRGGSQQTQNGDGSRGSDRAVKGEGVLLSVFVALLVNDGREASVKDGQFLLLTDNTKVGDLEILTLALLLGLDVNETTVKDMVLGVGLGRSDSNLDFLRLSRSKLERFLGETQLGSSNRVFSGFERSVTRGLDIIRRNTSGDIVDDFVLDGLGAVVGNSDGLSSVLCGGSVVETDLSRRDVSLLGDGIIDLNETSTLADGAVELGRLVDLGGVSVVLELLVDVGNGLLFLLVSVQVQGNGTSNVRSSHTGTRHDTVAVEIAGQSGVDVTTDTSNVGLKVELGRGTSRGEGGDSLGILNGLERALLVEGKSDSTSLDGGQESLTVSVGDGEDGNSDARDRGRDGTSNIVVDDDTNGTSRNSIVDLVSEGTSTSLNEGNLAADGRVNGRSSTGFTSIGTSLVSIDNRAVGELGIIVGRSVEDIVINTSGLEVLGNVVAVFNRGNREGIDSSTGLTDSVDTFSTRVTSRDDNYIRGVFFLLAIYQHANMMIIINNLPLIPFLTILLTTSASASVVMDQELVSPKLKLITSTPAS